jgi:hypothetical protein
MDTKKSKKAVAIQLGSLRAAYDDVDNKGGGRQLQDVWAALADMGLGCHPTRPIGLFQTHNAAAVEVITSMVDMMLPDAPDSALIDVHDGSVWITYDGHEYNLGNKRVLCDAIDKRGRGITK